MPVCPACRTKVRSKTKECPSCGWEFGRAGKIDCPFCGELVSVRSQSCPKCDFDLSNLSPKARGQSVDTIRRLLLAEIADIEYAERHEEELYTCPKCSALLDGTQPECPECGQLLIGKTGLRCPICGTQVDRRRKKCLNCGRYIGDLVTQALPMKPYAMGAVVVTEAMAEDFKVNRSCPACGAIVPIDMTKCPICDLIFEDSKPSSKIRESTPAPEPVMTTVPPSFEPQVASEVEEIAAEGRKEPEIVTAVDYSSKPIDRGFSNGIAHVNGIGRVNGTGAVNGKSFVNGTGISNGLGPRQRARTASRGRVVPRWQVFTVVVAMAVVLSAFAFLSYSDEQEYAIDGDFEDWSRATTYGTKIWSSSPSSNITEWAVVAQKSDLFLYFKTQARMMDSSEAESFYLFVDSDGTNSTGYAVDAIGAEYMLQVTGWGGTVNSSSVYKYTPSLASDRLDWNAWEPHSSPTVSSDGLRLEAKMRIPSALGNSSRFILLAKDSTDRGSVSYTAPLHGGVLIIEQIPSADATMDGIIMKSGSVEMLTLRFMSDGGSGRVDRVTPVVSGGGVLVSTIPPFTLDPGEVKDRAISVDTSMGNNGEALTVELMATGVESTFACVEILGSRASAYLGAPPDKVVVDGAFADWQGRLSVDVDQIPLANPSVDIYEVGNLSTTDDSFFYVSVQDGLCSGTYVPAKVGKPSGTGGGGGDVKVRQTAEDILKVFVDSDKSNSTGEWHEFGSVQIGADQMIEIKGLFGRITSMIEFNYSMSGHWVETPDAVIAAKDERRMEIGVSAASLNGSSDLDFIIETTSWKGIGDTAVFDQSSLKAFTRTWVVDPITTSRFATAMSCQRKLFFDGVNYWSLFFDGMNTVYKFSMDEGKTWSYGGQVFTTPGVNNTSIWFDSSASTVYAVGDTSSLSNNVLVQTGVVDSAAHKISWSQTDALLRTSQNPIAGKYAYISKDLNGYLWVLATNWTQEKPQQHDLTAFRSRAVNDTGSWMCTGGILPFGMYENNSKGSIIPAGSGSDMWAIYAYEGYVAAKRYNGAWPADYDETVIYKAGTSWANTDNAPPSVVVDGKGVVHVVYGTGRVDKSKTSIPQIEYSHSNPDLTFTAGLNLDPSNESMLIGNYYPTITLETSTNSLYVLWLQCDSLYTPRTVMGRKCLSGAWQAMNITPQTPFVKTYMTSAYSVPDEYKVCWQWTQNETGRIEVLFDSTWIPEFSGPMLPIMCLFAIFALFVRKSRKNDDSAETVRLYRNSQKHRQQ